MTGEALTLQFWVKMTVRLRVTQLETAMLVSIMLCT